MTISTVEHKPRVFCLHPLEPAIEELASKLFDFTPYATPGWENWPEEAEGVMVRGADITEEHVARFNPKLKFIAKHGVGVDQLAMKSIHAKGVTVMNTPGVNATAVAELAFGLAMAVARQIPLIDRRIRNGEKVTKDGAGALGIQLTGRTLGLIGGGNIGFKLGSMFNGAFKSPVIVYDPYLSPARAAEWEQMIAPQKFKQASTLEAMLAEADVISVHVPLLESTRDLIAEKELNLMKPSAILINTARGGIVNENALVNALDRGHLLGAGIDAFVTEPPSTSTAPRLVTHPRTVCTPHIGAASLDVIHTTALAVIDHLHEALSGQEPRNVVMP